MRQAIHFSVAIRKERDSPPLDLLPLVKLTCSNKVLEHVPYDFSKCLSNRDILKEKYGSLLHWVLPVLANNTDFPKATFYKVLYDLIIVKDRIAK